MFSKSLFLIRKIGVSPICNCLIEEYACIVFGLSRNVAKGENWKEKSLVISKIQAIMERSCSGNIKEALAAIRLDFRVVLMLVLKNQPIMAMRIARIEDFLYKGFRKKDK